MKDPAQGTRCIATLSVRRSGLVMACLVAEQNPYIYLNVERELLWETKSIIVHSLQLFVWAVPTLWILVFFNQCNVELPVAEPADGRCERTSQFFERMPHITYLTVWWEGDRELNFELLLVVHKWWVWGRESLWICCQNEKFLGKTWVLNAHKCYRPKLLLN